MYTVTWIIEVDADFPAQAARLAREIQLDPNSQATFFTVDGVTYDTSQMP